MQRTIKLTEKEAKRLQLYIDNAMLVLSNERGNMSVEQRKAAEAEEQEYRLSLAPMFGIQDAYVVGIDPALSVSDFTVMKIQAAPTQIIDVYEQPKPAKSPTPANRSQKKKITEEIE